MWFIILFMTSPKMISPAKLQKIILTLKVLRINNLLIISIAQWLTVRFLISSVFYDYVAITYLITSSVLVASAGFLFNDFIDHLSDSANNKLNSFQFFNLRKSQFFFLISVLSFIAFFLAWVSVPGFFLLQVCTLFITFLYSILFKKIIFLKNIFVSVLTAWAIGIFIFITDSYDPLILFFIFFAFWLNMIREIIKDMQDKKGDALAGISTIPVVFGNIFSWNYVTVLSLLLLVSEILCIYYLWDFFNFRIYFLLLVLIPSMILMGLIFKYRKNEEKLIWFNSITKGLMVTGIFSILFL